MSTKNKYNILKTERGSWIIPLLLLGDTSKSSNITKKTHKPQTFILERGTFKPHAWHIFKSSSNSRNIRTKGSNFTYLIDSKLFKIPILRQFLNHWSQIFVFCILNRVTWGYYHVKVRSTTETNELPGLSWQFGGLFLRCRRVSGIIGAPRHVCLLRRPRNDCSGPVESNCWLLGWCPGQISCWCLILIHFIKLYMDCRVWTMKTRKKFWRWKLFLLAFYWFLKKSCWRDPKVETDCTTQWIFYKQFVLFYI